LIVLDASMTLSWHFADEITPRTEAVHADVIAEGAVVPIHWRIEIANAFATAVRHGRLTPRFRSEALARLEYLPVEIDEEGARAAWGSVQDLCDRHRLTAYDAVYLELATRRNLKLATLDHRLTDAAKAVGVPLYRQDS
jgi:predicted nucleic acid-binding protein